MHKKEEEKYSFLAAQNKNLCRYIQNNIKSGLYNHYRARASLYFDIQWWKLLLILLHFYFLNLITVELVSSYPRTQESTEQAFEDLHHAPETNSTANNIISIVITKHCLYHVQFMTHAS